MEKDTQESEAELESKSTDNDKDSDFFPDLESDPEELQTHVMNDNPSNSFAKIVKVNIII